MGDTDLREFEDVLAAAASQGQQDQAIEETNQVRVARAGRPRTQPRRKARA